MTKPSYEELRVTKHSGTPIHHFKSHQRPAPYIQRVRDAVKRVAERLANFPRSSQNQTVSGGVEGAHEGTTADKAGSREPEKLNDAQKVCAVCGREPRSIFHSYDPTLRWPIHMFTALAESSLSSPPPTLQELMRQSWEGPGTVLEPDKVRENLGLKKASSPELLPTQLPKEK